MRFRSLLRDARRLLPIDAKAAVDAFDHALDLWRGPAFGDLATEPSLRSEAAQLDDLRLAAIEERIEAQLELGELGEVIGELEGLTARHPLRERFWEQLMLALYRAGRQGEALAAYDRARGNLADELGIDPSPDLRKRCTSADPRSERGPGSRRRTAPGIPIARTRRRGPVRRRLPSDAAERRQGSRGPGGARASCQRSGVRPPLRTRGAGRRGARASPYRARLRLLARAGPGVRRDQVPPRWELGRAGRSLRRAPARTGDPDPRAGRLRLGDGSPSGRGPRGSRPVERAPRRGGERLPHGLLHRTGIGSNVGRSRSVRRPGARNARRATPHGRR